MDLSIKTFWMLNENIDRILAQKDMRALTVAANSQGNFESFKAYRDVLTMEVGTTIKMEEQDPIKSAVRDEEGFQELKSMALQKL